MGNNNRVKLIDITGDMKKCEHDYPIERYCYDCSRIYKIDCQLDTMNTYEDDES